MKDPNKFKLEFDERGVQLHNYYIGKIADAIKKHYERKHVTHYDSTNTYGMICHDTKLCELWEGIFEKEGLL